MFDGKRHPRELGLAAVGQFLEFVARTETGPVPAVAESREALDFLYREVLHLDLGELPWPRPPRLLDQVRQVLRARYYAVSTEGCYVQWIRRFILFHGAGRGKEGDALQSSLGRTASVHFPLAPVLGERGSGWGGSIFARPRPLTSTASPRTIGIATTAAVRPHPACRGGTPVRNQTRPV